MGVVRREAGKAVLGSNRLQVHVPDGRQAFAQGLPLDKGPAPIQAIARAPDFAAVCKGALVGKDSLKALSVEAELLEEGPRVDPQK